MPTRIEALLIRMPDMQKQKTSRAADAYLKINGDDSKSFGWSAGLNGLRNGFKRSDHPGHGFARYPAGG